MKKKIYMIIVIIILILSVNFVSYSKVNNSNKAKINYKQMYEKLLNDQPPKIMKIQFQTPDGKILKPDGGIWYRIGSKIKIIITLKGDCQEVDLFTTPTGSAVYKEQKLIEIVTPEKNIAEYTWNVPKDFMGFLQIIAFNKNVGRRSELINISSNK